MMTQPIKVDLGLISCKSIFFLSLVKLKKKTKIRLEIFLVGKKLLVEKKCWSKQNVGRKKMLVRKKIRPENFVG